MLSGAPGGKLMQQVGGFELSQGFKLTAEFAEVIGLHDQPQLFDVFREGVVKGMAAVRRESDELLALLQLSMLGPENYDQACFKHPKGYPEAVLEDVRERLGLPRSGVENGHERSMTTEAFESFVSNLVDNSFDHWRSKMYDRFQYHFTGIHR